MPVLPVAVPTPDGSCDATLHLPPGDGPWPSVIFYPDAGGVRDTMDGMAERLAGLGYVTLLPDVYYRLGGFEPFDLATAFSDPDEVARLMGMVHGLTAAMSISDAGAFLDFLLARPEVTGERAGTTGYCMGGRISMIVAGHHPERIGAAASFHGGNLAPEGDPDSPHLSAGRITATVYVAGARDDDHFPADQFERLEKALTEGGVRHTLETYPAAHGFAVPDNPTYDPEASERHWAALATLYGSALGH
jgi:carboxymethylenebutenolidase